MNLLAQFNAIFKRENRFVAKIIAQDGTRYQGQTASGGQIWLYGTGAKVGDCVFFDTHSGQILGQAPTNDYVELTLE